MYVSKLNPFKILQDVEKVNIQLDSTYSKTKIVKLFMEQSKVSASYTTSPINIRSLFFKEVAKYDEIQSGLIPITDPNKMTLDVAFQRNLVWTLEQKQSLILSILQQMPIGMFYINESFDNPNIDVVLYDGKQRFDAIKGFLYGEFPITINNQDYYWYDLKDDDVATILSTSISINTTNFDSEVDLINYYLLINQAGRSHTEGDIQIALNELERLKNDEKKS